MNDKDIDGMEEDVPPCDIRGDKKIRGSFHSIRGVFNKLSVGCSATHYHWVLST